MDQIDHTNVVVVHVKVTTWINFDDINQMTLITRVKIKHMDEIDDT
jgi:hypothetical protein